MQYKKLIEDMLAQSQLTELPDELTPATFHIWSGDIDPQKDWDDFIGGQLVNHTYYESSFKAGVDTLNLEYGSNANSFYSLFGENTTLEIYTNEKVDLNGKMISIGSDLDKKFLAISHHLDNFKLKSKKESFITKIILVDIVKKISEELDDDSVAPTINISNGKLGETIKIPQLTKKNEKELHEAELDEWEVVDFTVGRVRAIEILLDKPSVISAPDFTTNTDGTVKTDRKALPANASTNPKHFPVNPFYSILPTQFSILSIDNYGFTHPADQSNVAKIISATQSIGAATGTGLSLGGSLGLGNIASGIGSAVVGLGQKFFGDKGTLANSGAITPSFVDSSSSGLKFFIQGDGAKANSKLTDKGYIDLIGLEAQADYLEINQGNGEFGKYGKPMSPINNSQFNDKIHYRALGVQNLKLPTGSIPALASPFAVGDYANLKIDDAKINDYLTFGAPRRRINSGEVLEPMLNTNDWPVYIRNMFFRPDPYSFWNWPMLMPAEVGIYDVENQTSIAYDISNVPNSNIFSVGISNADDNKNERPKSYWNKTITLDQLSNNDLYDPNKTFTSLRFEFAEHTFDRPTGDKTYDTNVAQILYQMQMFAFTDSTIQIKLLDDKNEIIREHKFNSQGKNTGSPASTLTVIQF